jgi:hypothetical protein
MNTLRKILIRNLSRPMRGLFAAWLLALIFMLFLVGIFFAGVFDFSRYAASHTAEFIPYAPQWTPHDFSQILSQFGLSLDGYLQFRLVTSIFVALVFLGVGFLIFIRNRNDWFSLYVGALFVLFGTISGDPLTVFSGLHPQLYWLLTPIGVLSWWGLFMLLFLFPNGQFVPPWTRWIALFLLLVYVVSILGYGTGTPPVPIVLLILSLFGIGAACQIYRYQKVSNPVERQQTKWVMYALVVTFVVLISSLLPLMIPDSLNPGSSSNILALVVTNLSSYILTLIPLSVAFAILRYRLWDIDLIIRRTLIYAILTASLGLVYSGSVLVLQQVFRALSGQDSPAVLVLSTLVIAALFTPLRRRIQAAIDRRFYRQKYDAVQAVNAFAATARNEVEIERLAAQLETAVQESLEPESVSLWLKKQEGNR